MREKAAPFYWAAAGALAGFGLIGLMTVGAPFLLVVVVLALVGLIFLRTRGLRAFFVGFGGLPALVFLLHISHGIKSALNPYCPQPGEPGMPGTPVPGPVSLSCSFVPASYYVMFGVFAAVALFGVAVRFMPRRTGRRAALT